MIRIIKVGESPAMRNLCDFDGTAGGALGLGAGGAPAGQQIAINGLPGSPATTLKPGDTAALQPKANNG